LQLANCKSKETEVRKLAYLECNGSEKGEGLSEECLKGINAYYKCSVRDNFTSFLFPAQDYVGAKALDTCSVQEIATEYSNMAKASNSLLALSCVDGHFQKRWANSKQLDNQRNLVSKESRKRSFEEKEPLESTTTKKSKVSFAFPAEKVKEKKKSKQQQKFCKNCNIRGHNEDKCWVLHPDLKPSNTGKGKSNKKK